MNKKKINYSGAKVYHYGRPNSKNIPELTLKNCVYKDEMYIDNLFGDLDNNEHAHAIGISTVIDVWHNKKTLVVDGPFDPTDFNGRSSYWDGTNTYIIPTKPAPKDNSYDFKTWRQQLLKWVMSNGGQEKGLLGWLSTISAYFPINAMSRVSDNFGEFKTGYYMKCNKCHALSYLPFSGLLPNDLSKQQFIHMLEVFMRNDLNEETGMLNLDPEIYGFDVSMITFVFSNANFSCYNCGKMWDETTAIMRGTVVDLPVPDQFSINGITIDMFKKMLYLGMPPDEDLPKSKNIFFDIANRDIGNILKRSNLNFINSLFDVNKKMVNDMLARFSSSVVNTRNNITNLTLSNIEIEECMIYSEMSSLCDGNILVIPSSAVIDNCVKGIVYCSCSSTWFTDLQIQPTVDKIEADTIQIQTAASNITLEDVTDNQYVLICHNPIMQDINYSYTPVTGSNVMVRWNRQICDILGKNCGFTMGNKVYGIRTIVSTESLQLVHVKEVEKTELQPRMRIGLGQLSVRLPKLDADSFLNTFGLYGSVWEEQTIDTSLVNRILINLLTGGKSIDSILTYISGLTTTRYTIGGKEVDLTGYEATDSLPELTFVLLLLHDETRIMSWLKMNYLTNIDVNNVRLNVYNWVGQRCMNLLLRTQHPIAIKIQEEIAKHLDINYSRDKLILKTKLKADFQAINPFIIIDTVVDWNVKLVNKRATNICHHHSKKCAHLRGDNPCLCCGFTCAPGHKLCKCCNSNSLKCVHLCDHACAGTKDHKCVVCNKGGNCGKQQRCMCCGVPSCFTICPVCNDADTSYVVKGKTMYQNTKTNIPSKSTVITTQNNEKKLVDECGEEKSNQSKTVMEKTHHKKHKNQLQVGTETYQLNNIQSMTTPNALVVKIGEKLFCPYVPTYCERNLTNAKMTELNIKDKVIVPHSCLYHCIARQTTYTVGDLEEKFGDKENANLNDVRHIVKSLKLNALVHIRDKETILLRFGDMHQEYISIAHGTCIDSVDDKHWFIPQDVTYELPWPCGLWDARDLTALYDDEKYKSINIFTDSKDLVTVNVNKINSEILANKATRLTEVISFPQIITINDKVYMSNNENHVHNIRQGKIHIEVPEEYSASLSHALNDEVETVSMDASSINVVEDFDNIDLCYKNQIEYSILQLYSERMKILHKDYSVKCVDDNSRITQLGRTYIYNPSQPVKSLDLVVVRMEDGREFVRAVSKIGPKITLTDLDNDVKEVVILKVSMGSLIRNLVALIRWQHNVNYMSSLVVDKIVEGYGGTGKSYDIHAIENKSSWVVVAKTRSPLVTYYNSGFKMVTTVEQIRMDEVILDKVIIEEASQVDLYDIITLVRKNNVHIMCFGDTTQVGVMDVSDVPGYRSKFCALDLPSENKEKRCHVHRYGNPLAEDIVKLTYPDIVVDEERITTWSQINLNSFDQLVEQLIKDDIDVIYCFYHEHFMYLSNILRDRPIIVRKVHGNQGSQGERVAVLYWRDSTGGSGILHKNKFINTAITRAQSHLLWITEDATNDSLQNIVLSSISGNGILNNVDAFDFENLRLKRKLNNLEVEMINGIVKLQGFTEDEVKVKNDEILLCKSGAVFTLNSEGLIPLNLKAKISYKMNREFIERKVKEYLQKTTTIQEVKENEVDEEFYDVNSEASWLITNNTKTKKRVSNTIALDAMAYSRLVMLADAALVQSMSGLSLPLHMFGTTCTCKVFNGCSLTAGIIFNFNDDEVIISSGHLAGQKDTLLSNLTLHIRNVNGPSNYVTMVTRFLTVDGRFFFPQVDGRYIMGRLLERIGNILGSRLSGMSTGKCCTQSPGMTKKEMNESWTKGFKEAGGRVVMLPTHQQVKHGIRVNMMGQVVVYPNNVIVNTITDLVRVMMGVQGLEDEVEVNLSNRMLMDKALTKKMRSIENATVRLYVPQSVLTKFSSFVEVNLNDKFVHGVGTSVSDDTIAAIVNAYFMNIMYKQFRKKFLDIRDIVSQTITLQGYQNYKLDTTELDEMNRTHIDRVTRDIILSLEEKIKQTSGTEKKELEVKLKQITTEKIYVRKGQENESILIGLGGDMSRVSTYSEIYVICADNVDTDGVITTSNGERWLLGNNGRLLKDTQGFKMLEIHRLGIFTLNKIVTKKPTHTLNVAYGDIIKIREFEFEGGILGNVKIPDRFYKKLLSRAIIKDTTEEDMLAFARSLCATQIYTSAGVRDFNTIHPVDVYKFVIIVMNVANRMRKHFNSAKRILEHPVDKYTGFSEIDDLINIGKSIITTTVGQFLHDTKIIEMLRNVLDYYVQNQPIIQVVRDILKDVVVKEVKTKLIIVSEQDEEDEVFYQEMDNDDKTPHKNINKTGMSFEEIDRFDEETSGSDEKDDNDEGDTQEESGTTETPNPNKNQAVNDNGKYKEEIDKLKYMKLSNAQKNELKEESKLSLAMKVIDQERKLEAYRLSQKHKLFDLLKTVKFDTTEEIEPTVEGVTIGRDQNDIDKMLQRMYPYKELTDADSGVLRKQLNIAVYNATMDINREIEKEKIAHGFKIISKENRVKVLSPEEARIITQYTTTEPTKIPKGNTVLMVYAGSRGDSTPMNSILEQIHDKMKVTVIAPMDAPLQFEDVKYHYYCKDYNAITQEGGNNNKMSLMYKLIPMIDKLFTVYKSMGDKKFDYTVGLFFSGEACVKIGRVANYMITPQVYEGESIKDLKPSGLLGYIMQLNVKNHVTNLWSLPTCIKPLKGTESGGIVDDNKLNNGDNLGFLMCNDEFVMDATTQRVVDHLRHIAQQVTLVTLGSMCPDDYPERIKNMTYDIDGTILLVTGAMTRYNLTLDVRGKKCKSNVEMFTQDLVIVSSIKHKLMGNFIKEARHHGGAGTMCTFGLLHVPQKIYPFAFDQPRNKEWLKENASIFDNTNLVDEINNSREQIRKAFKLPALSDDEKVKYIEFPTYETHETKFNDTPKILCDIQMTIMKKVVYEIFNNPVGKDCILTAMTYYCSPSLKEYITEQYKRVTAFMRFTTMEELILFGMILNLPGAFIHKNGAALFTKNDQTLAYIVHIDDKMQHASPAKLVESPTDIEIKSPISKEPSIWNFGDLWPSEVDKIRQEMIKQVMQCLAVGESTSGMTLGTWKTPSFINSLKTEMRKMNSVILTINMHSTIGYVIDEDQSLNAGYWYLLMTNIGVIPGFCMRNRSAKSNILLHGVKEILTVCCVYRLHKEQKYNETRKIEYLTRTSKIVAINQSTKKFANEIGQMVYLVGAPDADNLYIYNTMNRQHHLEKERECIITAKHIMILPDQVEEKIRERLLKTGVIRMIVLKGQPLSAMEVSSDKDDINKQLSIFRKINKYKLNVDNLLVFDLLTEKEEENLRKVVNVNVRDGVEIGTYKVTSERELPTRTTLGDLLELIRVEQDVWLCNKLKQTFGAKYKEEALELVDNVRINIAEVERVYHKKMWVTDTNAILVSENLSTYIVTPKGAGIMEVESMRWSQPNFDPRKHIDKFGLVIKQSNNQNTRYNVKELHTITRVIPALIPGEGDIESDLASVDNVTLDEFRKEVVVIEMYETPYAETSICPVRIDDLPDAKTMDYWDDDGLLEPKIILPTNRRFTVSSRVEPQAIRDLVKIKMEEYPTYARPSLTALYNEELNSITNRYGAYTQLAIKPVDPKKEYALFKENYYRSDYKRLLLQFQQHPIGIEIEDIQKWIIEHNYPKAVLETLKKHIEETWERHRVNDVEAHGKIEQTTKLSVISRWFDEVVSRSIMAGSYAMSAIFGTLFKEVKMRVKECLHEGIFYADGATPEQIKAKIKSTGNFEYIIEDDLTQQDRQTQWHVIETERLIYKDLGIIPEIVDFYLMCHHKWRWRGHGIKGVWDAMRLTGQVTTAIGNWITNLLVHNRFYKRNRQFIKCLMALGDDFAATATRELNVKNHGTETKELYNMISKITQKRGVGNFLSMLIHNCGGEVELCPHFKRIRHRFSVCNYSYTPDEREGKIASRTLSYCLMLGNIKESKEICRKINPNVAVPNWYDVSLAIEANAIYDNSSPEKVEEHIGKLINMMGETNGIQKVFHGWTHMHK
jgi:hypothetical protein